MKKLFCIHILAAVILAPTCLADWHQFKSADGSKTLWAEVKAYDAESNMVTLSLKDQRTIKSLATAFSEADQEYLKKASLALAAGRNLWVEFKDVENIVSEKKNPTNGYQTKSLENGFELNIRNNGKVPFKGLTADYQIFYAGYKNPLKDDNKVDQVQSGNAELPELSPREEAKVETDTVAMTTIKRLPLSQCTGGT